MVDFFLKHRKIPVEYFVFFYIATHITSDLGYFETYFSSYDYFI